MTKKSPPKREVKKEKVVEHTLTSGKPTSKFRIELTQPQKGIVNFLRQNKVSLLTGESGTSKDTICFYRGLDAVMNKEFEKLIVVRPLVQSGSNLGFLKGPQPLYSSILTPNGWSTIEKIGIGEDIIGKDGKIYSVEDKSTINYEPVYEITTTDGRKTRCSINHLFHTLTFNDKKHRLDPIKYKKDYNGSVKTLGDIIDTFKTNGGKINHYLPYNEPTEFISIEKEIHPYLLGVLIGDGHISDSIGFSNVDQELIDKCVSICNSQNLNVKNVNNTISYTISSNKENNKPAREVILKDAESDNILHRFSTIGEALKILDIKRGTLNSRCANNVKINNVEYLFGEKEGMFTNPLKESLRKIGLSHIKSYDKFIPQSYIYNSSIEERIELLRGLCDTDGACDGRVAAYTTTSERLAKDIIKLVQSLGGRCTMYVRDRIGKKAHLSKEGREIHTRRKSYELCITLNYNPFYISRKAERYNPNYKHLIGIKNIEKLENDYVQCIKTTAEDGLYITDDFIVTHNSLEEKTSVYEDFYKYHLGKILNKTELDRIKNKIEFETTQFSRGKNWEYSFIIVSESQSFTLHELFTLVTRVSDTSIIVFNGDYELQNDIGNKSGYKDFINIIREIDGIDYVHLGDEFQMRSQLITQINRAHKNFLNKDLHSK